MERKRFIVRKEFFGAIIYDLTTYSFFCVNEESLLFLEKIKQYGLSKAVQMYEADYEVQSFIVQLKEIELLSKNNSVKYNIVFNGNSNLTNNLSAPIKVFLTITDKCNLSCKHCFGDFGCGTTKEQDLSRIKKH